MLLSDLLEIEVRLGVENLSLYRQHLDLDVPILGTALFYKLETELMESSKKEAC